MAKMLALGGFLFEAVTAAGSFAVDAGQTGLATWVAVNASLLVLPVAYRTLELLWTAVSDAPEVLRWDVVGNRELKP